MTQRKVELTDTTFDLAIIGAGINGAGIARDAAMRGLNVLLLDKDDITSGTSSASTRLIHGGLRYLEHGELGLVRESLREREILFRTAPHLVKPLAMLIPIYEGQTRSAFMIRAGMLAYDLLSFHKSVPQHRMISRKQTLERVPGLSPKGLNCAAIYFDGQVEFAERLVLENVIAARDHGARVLTHTKVNKFIVAGERIEGVEFSDQLTGEDGSARSRVVINAAGPWVDEILENAGTPSPRLIGGTKGSHIVVATFPGAPTTALYVEASTDRRPFFVIPWNERLLIGTTDISYNENPDAVGIDTRERDYLLSETNKLFPAAQLGPGSILFSYSGVRPLPFSTEGNASAITRRHFIRRHPTIQRLYSVVGGKLTTYRSVAEDIVDKVIKDESMEGGPCRTANVPLPGAVGHLACTEHELVSEFKVSELVARRLLRIYGASSRRVLELSREDDGLGEVFDEETGAIAAEIVFSFKEEFARTLSDCLLRRTMVGFNSTSGLNAVQKAARVALKYLGWSEGRTEQEVEKYREDVKRLHGVV